jgi:hypothetical protein
VTATAVGKMGAATNPDVTWASDATSIVDLWRSGARVTRNLDGTPYAIIGILPANMGFPGPDIDACVPMAGVSGLPWDSRRAATGRTRRCRRTGPTGRETRGQLASESSPIVTPRRARRSSRRSSWRPRWSW